MSVHFLKSDAVEMIAMVCKVSAIPSDKIIDQGPSNVAPAQEQDGEIGATGNTGVSWKLVHCRDSYHLYLLAMNYLQVWNCCQAVPYSTC